MLTEGQGRLANYLCPMNFIIFDEWEALNRSGFPEAISPESCRPGDVLGLSIIARFGLGGRNVADRFEQAPVVEAVHPFQGDELDGFQGVPGPPVPDHLDLVEAADRLGQGIVVRIATSTNIRRVEQRSGSMDSGDRAASSVTRTGCSNVAAAAKRQRRRSAR